MDDELRKMLQFDLFYYLETFLKCSTFEKKEERNICEDADLHVYICS